MYKLKLPQTGKVISPLFIHRLGAHHSAVHALRFMEVAGGVASEHRYYGVVERVLAFTQALSQARAVAAP